MSQDTGAPSAMAEFEAIRAVYSALQNLDPDARQRVVKYISNLLQAEAGPPAETATVVERIASPDGATARRFSSLAELYDAVDPQTNAERALVAAVWLQEFQGADSFTAQSVNTELKHLGEGVGNITNALDQLRDMRPSFVLQLRKSGATQQARKTYKVTVAGLRALTDMISKV